MRLLIVGDLNGGLSLASKIACQKGAKVRQVQDVESALNMLRIGNGADLLMVDVRCNVKSLINSLNQERIFVPVVACGLNSDADEAVSAIKAGAKEYLPLPPNEELIAAIIETITRESDMVISKSSSMQKIYRLIDQVAKSNANILITGESGVGKEVFSRYIHKKSNRKDNPFVSINCAAVPENLLESELFGHEKGSFTGAIARRIGKFEEANNGTLLLDEISEIDIRLQAKLLRAIQEREIQRVGGNQSIKLNLRIIATSNRKLKEEVLENRFREDLYFRLNIINIELPPLRERKEDLLDIAENFVKKFSKNNFIDVKPLSQEAKEAILTYDWPGNIRELENAIQRAVLLSESSEIDACALMIDLTEKHKQNKYNINSTNLVGRKMQDVEKELIISTLEHCLGNRTQAANILGISIRTLRNKLNNYRLGVAKEE